MPASAKTRPFSKSTSVSGFIDSSALKVFVVDLAHRIDDLLLEEGVLVEGFEHCLVHFLDVEFHLEGMSWRRDVLGVFETA